MHPHSRPIGSALLASLIALLLPMLGASAGPCPCASLPLARAQDPVIVKGQSLGAYAGAQLGHLYVFKYDGVVWSQIPWQFDEVTGGKVVAAENNALDADDELVFMAADTGVQAPSPSWIPDVASRSHVRYEIEVRDPLDAARKGWVYVYRSTLLTPASTTDYVNLDEPTSVLSATSYRAAMLRGKLCLNRLEMNGSGVNIIDRTKLRITALGTTATEDDITASNLVRVRDGKVRVVASMALGDVDLLRMFAYGSAFQTLMAVDLSGYGVAISFARASADLNTAATGSTYYDANTVGGVTVDGVPDAVTISPPSDWAQVSGATGTVIQIVDATGMGGTKRTYYKDDAILDATDTGDKKSYSDVGMVIDSPGSRLALGLWHYVLGANLPNVGAEYRARVFGPLATSVVSQTFVTLHDLYLPLVLRNH